MNVNIYSILILSEMLNKLLLHQSHHMSWSIIQVL